MYNEDLGNTVSSKLARFSSMRELPKAVKFVGVDDEFIARAVSLGYNIQSMGNINGIVDEVYGIKFPAEMVVCNTNGFKIASMDKLLCNCTNLKQIEFSNVDTSHVENMGETFYNCSNLEHLGIRDINTANAKEMTEMFYNCQSLKELDISNFNTEQVTDMTAMFKYCKSLERLNLSNFRTEQVKSMFTMFSYCASLKELDIRNFSITQDTNIDHMFIGCISLEKVHVNKDIKGIILSRISRDIEDSEITNVIGRDDGTVTIEIKQ